MAKLNFRVDEIVLVLIVAVLAMVVGIYDKSNHTPFVEAEKITDVILGNQRINFAGNGVVDEAKLNQIKVTNYNDLKDALDIKNDFCIYIKDETGSIILAKGSPAVNIDGVRCIE